MQKRSISHQALVMTLTMSFLVPVTPLYAQDKVFPIDLLPPKKMENNNDAGLFPTFPTVGKGDSSGKSDGNKQQNGNQNQGQNRPGVVPTTQSKNATVINVAKVPAEFTCQLFDNSSNSEIFAAIDALSKEVKSSPACNGDPSAKSLQENGDQIKESILALTALMNAQTGTDVNPTAVDQSITTAITSLGNIGDIINNNEFLNSDCGGKTMSSGRLLLALNDVIAGLSPYALLAVSMNAALAPALPFVIGAVVGTTGISAITKMFNQNLIDMNNPEHRKAVVQNTCQFVKVSEKVRFLQLAQAGKIDQINRELKNKIDLYSSTIKNYSGDLRTSISQRNTYLDAISTIENQYTEDRKVLTSLEAQIKENDDNFLTCVLANDMTKWGQDGVSFPVSAFNNFKKISTQSDRTMQAQATALRALHDASIKKISQYAQDAATNDRSVQLCAEVSRSWLNGISRALKLTYDTTQSVRAKVESELSKSEEYVTFQAQAKKLDEEKILISRVQKAMQELSNDSSIIDRSEMAQRLTMLKAGLFKGQSNVPFAGNYTSLVQQWINHTKKMHHQALAAVDKDIQALRAASYSITDIGRILSKEVKGTPYIWIDPKVSAQGFETSKKLANLNLRNLSLGSREHDMTCQQLQVTWLDYTAAIDHLGAIQFFCDMIDPVLDNKVDISVLNSCRGNTQLNGTVVEASLVDKAQQVIVTKGYQADVEIVRQRIKDLQCPIPSLNVMNQ